MDVEGRLLSRTLRERNWLPIMAADITEEWFHDEEHRSVFTYVAAHYRKHGEVPTVGFLRQEFPNYNVVKIEDSLDALVDQFKDRHAYGRVVEMLQDAGEKVDTERDWKGAVDLVLATANGILQEASSLQDIDLTKTWETRLDEYELRAERDGALLGIPTGFPTIDRATSGWQRKQLVTIIATPKIGKSTLMMRLALNAWLEGYRVLFISFEMSNDEQAARHDAMIGGIPHTAYLRGTLTEKQLDRLERELARTDGKQSFILSADISAVTTVSGIDAKIEQHQPDIVFVDGVYLMRDELGEPEGSPQALTNITRNLKRVAQRRDIPLISSTQALLSKVNKKRGVQADSIGYSSSFAQDSDVILGLQEDADEDEMYRMLRVVMSRNCGRVDTKCVWDWGTSTFEEAPGWGEEEDVA